MALVDTSLLSHIDNITSLVTALVVDFGSLFLNKQRTAFISYYPYYISVFLTCTPLEASYTRRMTLREKTQRAFWNLLYPIFPYLERVFLFAHKKKRQPFLLGWLTPGKTLAELQKYLSKNHQFGNHFVAWEDPDQVLSWRKLDGFENQYHLRVYADGELRGHYERTPEAAPIAHFLEKGETPRKEDFTRFLGPFLSKSRHIQIPPLCAVQNTTEEITFSEVKGK